MTADTSSQNVLITERIGGIALLKLNRPERLNALSPQLHEALKAAVREAAEDKDVRVVVITGEGRAFCSGGDTGGARGQGGPVSQEQRIDEMVARSATNQILHEMPKPSLALVNGVAAGSGLALALACDMRIGSVDASMVPAYAKLALSGDYGVTYFLTQLAGPAKACELMFLNQKLDAAEAKACGLLNQIVSTDSLMAEGVRVAEQLCDAPPVALRYMKRSIRASVDHGLGDVIALEASAMIRCSKTEDAKEAMLALKEKRVPVFKGY
jgi:2-(1,2-epoxy-1,2-dihydrophenyl)acetyl-CoA isomerase